MAIVFLLPACILEYKKNPYIENARNRYISGCKIAAIICIILCLIGTVMYLQNPIDDPATGNKASGNLSVAIVFGISTIVLF